MTSIEFLCHVFDINGVNLSDSRVQGINDFPEPTSVKGVRSFIGMATLFRDFFKDLFRHMVSLRALTKKRSASDPFKMTQQGRASFAHIKGLCIPPSDQRNRRASH